jgi:hypothetical protein
MADEVIEQESTEQEPISGGDPFADAKAEDTASQTGQSEAVKAAQQEYTTPVEPEAQPYKFGNTPYESEKDAVAGYKHLQANYTRTSQELSVLKNQMAQVVGSLKGGDTKAGPDPADVDKFLREFIKNPKGSMRELIQAVSHEQLAPIRSELTTGRASTAVAAFKSNYPWLNKDDEAALERILLNNPQLTNLGNNPQEKDITASLKSALGMFIAENPSGYNRKVEAHKNRTEHDVNEAKKAAGAVGGKKGSVVQTPGVERDAFDDVLESDAQFRAKYASR